MKKYKKKCISMTKRKTKVGKKYHELQAKVKAKKNDQSSALSKTVRRPNAPAVIATETVKVVKKPAANGIPFKIGMTPGNVTVKKLMENANGDSMECSEGHVQRFNQKDSRVEGAAKSSAKAYYKEFKQVIEEADVILEVLDARDPLGFRSPDLERAVQEAGPSKRIILLLNKADLIPRDNLVSWLKHLRTYLPTVAFKSSVSRKKVVCRHGGGRKKRLKLLKSSQEMLQSSPSVGMQTLMSLLNNYCRNKGIKGSICVGVVGYPNVGKSSVINSLKRDRACDVGAQAGVTKQVQTIQLTKNIKLLDSPGLILSQEGGTEAALKNAVNIQQLGDPISLVEAILMRIPKQNLLTQYNIEDFKDAHNFLCRLALKRGSIKKGGRPNTEEAARLVVHEWQTGKIRYYTDPPAAAAASDVSSTIVTELAKEFDLDSIMMMETQDMMSMQEGNKEEEKKEQTADNMETNEGEKVFHVETENNRKKKRKKKNPEDKVDPATLLPGNQKLNRMLKKKLKRSKKEERRSAKRVERLAGDLEHVLKCI